MIELVPIQQLDPDMVQAALDEVLQRVRDDNPGLDLRRGVLAELLVYYHAVLDSQRQTNINDYLEGRSLLAISQDPDGADPDLVDDVLSNFRVERKPGSRSTGDVTVVLSDNVTVTIAAGAVWQAQGREFVTTQAFTAKIEAGQVVVDSDRLLTETADGNWAFTITVEAADDGESFDVPKDTLVVPLAVPANYVTSFAASDFSGGLAEETNAELITRLQEGIAAKALSNRVNMAAALRAVEAFSRVVTMSIVGFGDAEMLRAFHTMLPVALGCRVDWYVRTQQKVLKLKLTKTATLVSVDTAGVGTWQISIARDEAPGFYEFVEIRQVGASEQVGGYTVTSDVRGLDLSGTGFTPDIVGATEAAYSAYSVATIQFADTDTDATDLSAGDQRDYELAAVCLPLIQDIQTHVNSRDVRHYGGDCLVKAPVPCFVQLSLTVHKKAGDADPDVTGMKEALATVVNTIGFVGVLYGSQLQNVVHDFLASGQTASIIDMLGRIRYPDGTIRWVRDGEVLSVPDSPGNMVSARTVQFFTEPASISVSVVTSIPSGE